MEKWNNNTMIIIDSNIYVAYFNKRDENHIRAKNLVKNLLKGEYGNRFTISEVFSEVSTILFRQTKNIEIVKKAWNAIYEKEIAWAFPIIITKDLITNAWEIFTKYTTSRVPLSFVDCLLIATAQNNSITSILSFNSEFDGILTRFS